MANAFHATVDLVKKRTAQLSLSALLITSTIGVFCWQGTKFLNDLQRDSPISSLRSPASAPEKETPSKVLFALFGVSGKENFQATELLEKLPESNLNLQVSAIFFIGNTQQSSIIIEDGDRTLILKPGEEVRPGVAVQLIESNRVTLKRNGKLEQISFRGFGELQNNNADVNDITSSAHPPNADSLAAVNSPEAPALAENSTPTAYQQFIQRKLAQTKQ